MLLGEKSPGKRKIEAPKENTRCLLFSHFPAFRLNGAEPVSQVFVHNLRLWRKFEATSLLTLVGDDSRENRAAEKFYYF